MKKLLLSLMFFGVVFSGIQGIQAEGFETVDFNQSVILGITPRGVILEPQKSVSLSGNGVKGKVSFSVKLTQTSGKFYVAGVTSTHTLTKTNTAHSGNISIKITSYTPGFGKEFKDAVSISYDIYIGTTKIIGGQNILVY